MSRLIAACLVLDALLALQPAPSPAQESRNFDFYARGPYRAAVPRPSRILGYEPGEFHTTYGGMERVVTAIAEAAADRVRLTVYGRSEERRPLYLLAVSSPENIARLEEIRRETARLADPRATTPAQAGTLAATLPIVVWLNYANDGNESAAFEAAMAVLYQLAASEEPATAEMLRRAVVVITPAHNPESHERFVAWYNAFGSGAADPAALEHDAPWGMSTNNNHFQIDLNRDALALTQRETRALVRAFLEWRPQVFVDHHGQTTQYFFSPAAPPVNQNVPPETARWMEVFGRGNAAAFDRYGWPYYVRDIFDLFYAGYWDSWPALNGATGMTYETDGGGDRGLAWRRGDGSVVTLRDGIAKHVTASLATVETAVANREARLRDYYEFRRSGMQEARRQPMKRVAILPGLDPRRAAEVAAILLRHGVEVGRTTAAFTSQLAHEYGGAERPTRRSFAPGAYLVDLAQPQKRLAQAILEPQADLDTGFVREQLARRERNARRGKAADRERYEFYDVAGWSLPLTYGVEAYWMEDAPMVPVEPLGLAGEDEDVVAGLAPEGGVAGGTRANSAYLFPNDRNGAAALAMALLSADYRVAVATRAVRAGGRTFPRGTFVVRVSRNSESVHDSIGPWARRLGVEVTPIHSAFADSGQVGIGGESVVPVRRPRILLAAGEGVSPTGYGALWFLLERRLGVPFTPVRVGAIARMDELSDYNVLVFPAGSPSEYEEALGERGVNRLREWIERGGAFIGIRGGARFAMRKDVDLTSSRPVGAEADSARPDTTAARDTARAAATARPAGPGGTGAAGAAPAGAGPATGQRAIPPLVSPTAGDDNKPVPVPGSIFRATLDMGHWLTLGYERDQLPVMMSGDQFFRPSREGDNPVVFIGDSLLVSGFAWPGNTERLLRGSAWVVVENRGRGRVVLFADDPVFRLFWRSTERLLTNAILFGPLR